ncbi:MAG: dihydroorotase [Clostridiales bacterium]|nr:dihydroorotase [Clostridiales bacterium]
MRIAHRLTRGTTGLNGWLKGATVYRQGKLQKGDVAVWEGKIAEGVPFLPHDGGSAVPIVFSENCIISPGFADVHVHLREPGFSYKETMETGTRAAARGGYTMLCSMPNLNPAPDTVAHLREQLTLIGRDARVRVKPYGCITLGQKGEGELVDYAALTPYVAGFSDDGRGVQSESTMREAMTRIAAAGGLLAAHCEQDDLLRGGYVHQGAYARAHGHRGISSESEWRQVERDLRLARETGCKYHVCHVSCKESAQLIRRAKAQGVDVTCETAPHYLLLCDEDLQEDGRFKMNPPLRSREDRDALVAAALDGTIDMIATDHAPHAASEKSLGLEKSAMGVVGLECAFAVLYTGLVRTGTMPLERLLHMLTDAPRARFGLSPKTLSAGESADLTVLDLSRAWTVDPADFLSRGRATPFAGARVYGSCELTLVGGETVWQRSTGSL